MSNQPMTREQYNQYQQQLQQQQQQQQKMQIIGKRLAYIKAELHQSLNVYSINARIRETLDLMEYYLFGAISDAQPNTIPGTPASAIDDPTKTRVEFTSGPGAVMQHQQRQMEQAPNWTPTPDPFAPQAQRALPAHSFAPAPPVNTGDVQFIPGPPPGTSTGVGNGQKVEFVDSYGRPVDGNGKLIGQEAQPQNPFPPAPPANTPVSNQPPEIRANVQTRPVEAGGHVLPPPPTGFMSSPAAGEIFPGNPAPPPTPGAPTTYEEARQVLPIPVMQE